MELKYVLSLYYIFNNQSNQINRQLFIHTYKQVYSVYKSKVFKSIYIYYTNTTIVDIMHSIYI